MVLDDSLLNTQHNKLRIKGKAEQSRVRSIALLGVVATEKGDFGSPSSIVAKQSIAFEFHLGHNTIKTTKKHLLHER